MGRKSGRSRRRWFLSISGAETTTPSAWFFSRPFSPPCTSSSRHQSLNPARQKGIHWPLTSKITLISHFNHLYPLRNNLSTRVQGGLDLVVLLLKRRMLHQICPAHLNSMVQLLLVSLSLTGVIFSMRLFKGLLDSGTILLGKPLGVAKPARWSSITCVRLSVKAPIHVDSAKEALIKPVMEGLIAVPESLLTVTVETEDPCSRSLGIVTAKMKLWVVGIRRPEEWIWMNKALIYHANYLTPLKYQGTNRHYNKPN